MKTVTPKQTADQISEWINNNRSCLPLNIDSWKIQLNPRVSTLLKPKQTSLGRYQSTSAAFFAFYKPISRIGKFQCYE